MMKARMQQDTQKVGMSEIREKLKQRENVNTDFVETRVLETLIGFKMKSKDWMRIDCRVDIQICKPPFALLAFSNSVNCFVKDGYWITIIISV